MDNRAYEANASATPPTAPAAPSSGYPKPGNPATNDPATKPGPYWYFQIGEEIRSVVTGAGLTPNINDSTQLRQAILSMIQSANSAVIITGTTFAVGVANGDAVRWDSGASNFAKAIADGTVNDRAVGFADVTNSKVYCYGETPALFSGLTPGSRYYLDATTAGAITTTKPSDAVIVGIAKSATTLFADVDLDPSAALPALGQVQLAKSGANLVLSPKNGNKLTINGVAQAVPSAGVSLAPTGLTASTVYYIYAYMNAGTMTLEASATGYAVDTATGVTIKNGDATRTLVGLANTDGSVAWTTLVRSWFNDPGFVASAAFTATRNTTGTTYSEMNSEIRVSFLAWSGEVIRADATGPVNIGLNDNCYVGIGFDGNSPVDGTNQFGTTAGGAWYVGLSLSAKKSGLSDGLHYATLMGRGTASSGFLGAASAPDRCALSVFCKR